MADVEITCNYCNHVWQFYPNFYTKMEDTKCPICKDSNVKAKEMDKTKGNVFGYPEEKK